MGVQRHSKAMSIELFVFAWLLLSLYRAGLIGGLLYMENLLSYRVVGEGIRDVKVHSHPFDCFLGNTVFR